MKKLSQEMRTVIEAAIRAPSGENCQPWRFAVDGDSIDIYVRPEQDQSLYNWGNRAAYLSVGAAIENAVIAASEEQCKLSVVLFPENDPLLVARGTLVHDKTITPDPLAQSVLMRATNRKPFKKTPLTTAETGALLDAGNRGNVSCMLTGKRAEMAVLGKAGSTNEVVMLQNQYLHDFFFSHINWTREDDERKRIGFFIDTLELQPPARLAFKILRSWGWTRFLNKLLHFNEIVGKQNGATNSRAAAMGVLASPKNTPEGAVEAGRVLERVWLTATALGLGFQPLAGIPYFYLRIEAGEHEHFSDDDIERIECAHKAAANVFGTGDDTIFFMFRIGHGAPPAARAIRLPLEEVVTIR